LSRSGSSPDRESATAQRPDARGVSSVQTRQLPHASGLHGLIEHAEEAGIRVFFFGSQPRTIYRLRDKVSLDFPGLAIAGICDADFKGAVSPAIVDFIVAAKPGMIVVDMAEREFRAFTCANCDRFPDASLVQLDGAFSAYVRPQREQTWLSRGLPAAAMPRLLRRLVSQGLSVTRFSSIILAQALQGGMSRVRLVRPGTAMRRDG
jgi:hypothetical protein